MKVVIVGGVAGGASAAARIRRLDESAEITVFEKSGYISYANCGLPYYIGDVITDPRELTLQTPESFRSRFNIDVRVSHEVTAINKDAKTVSVKNLISGEEWNEPYDKLLLSPGAKPVIPDIQGADSDMIFTLRTVEDTFRIHEYINETAPQSAVVVGGGYIGIETAENLRERGIDVTIIQRPPQLMNTLDYDMAAFVHSRIRSAGINLLLNSNVTGFREERCDTDGSRALNGNDGISGLNSKCFGRKKIKTVLADGSEITSDLVLLAIGVSPENSLAKSAGLELGVKGTIAVNDRMETSEPDIYAVGDAVQVNHFVTGEKTAIALAGPANKQGRIAADNICGGDSRYKGSMGSSVIKIFDMTVASTGLTEKAAGAAGIDFESVVLSPSSHAGYYPGAKVMTMKVVFEKNTLRLLGAQIAGTEGVDKRLDVIAACIGAGVKADSLRDLDLSYAPPYSSAKDPVNMAGFMIDNINKGFVKQYHWYDVENLPLDGSVTLLDTRTAREYQGGHIEGFKNIPVDSLRERLDEIDRNKPVYVICQSGVRSYIACRILAQNGFDCYNFSGGYRFYAIVIQEKLLSESAYPCGIEK